MILNMDKIQFENRAEIGAILNNPARRVGRGFRCSRQDFSHWDALEPRFSPELRFS